MLAQGIPTGTSELVFKAIQTYSDGTVVSWIEAPDKAVPDPRTRHRRSPSLHLVESWDLHAGVDRDDGGGDGNGVQLIRNEWRVGGRTDSGGLRRAARPARSVARSAEVRRKSSGR